MVSAASPTVASASTPSAPCSRWAPGSLLLGPGCCWAWGPRRDSPAAHSLLRPPALIFLHLHSCSEKPELPSRQPAPPHPLLPFLSCSTSQGRKDWGPQPLDWGPSLQGHVPHMRQTSNLPGPNTES